VSSVKAVIFDLDNCLSAADEVGNSLFEPGFEAIRQANHGKLSNQALEDAFSDCWRHSLDFVAARHGFSEAMLAAGWQAFSTLEVKTPMSGYADLPTLGEIDALRFLVTSGFRRLQESKIRALGIQRLFTEILIDAIDDSNRKGKQQIFSDILESYHLTPTQVLVVGDNPDSEIAAGNRLGIKTVQILRPGVSRCTNASCYVDGLGAVKELVTSSPKPSHLP
jgi:FMN phosphatase YigB (HAD superfamily)